MILTPYVPLATSLCALLCAALTACSAAPGLTPQATAAPATRQATLFARTADTETARQRKAAPGRAPMLLSPFGQVAAPDPAALPADPSVRTRAGLYITRIEAEELAFWLGGEAVWVDVGCCGSAAIEVALGIVVGIVAANDLADDVPVFVSGQELKLAAQVVDRLSDQRHTRVYLISR